MQRHWYSFVSSFILLNFRYSLGGRDAKGKRGRNLTRHFQKRRNVELSTRENNISMIAPACHEEVLRLSIKRILCLANRINLSEVSRCIQKMIYNILFMSRAYHSREELRRRRARTVCISPGQTTFSMKLLVLNVFVIFMLHNAERKKHDTRRKGGGEIRMR